MTPPVNFDCPHCKNTFTKLDPLKFLGDQKCPYCDKLIWVTMEEQPEGILKYKISEKPSTINEGEAKGDS